MSRKRKKSHFVSPLERWFSQLPEELVAELANECGCSDTDMYAIFDYIFYECSEELASKDNGFSSYNDAYDAFVSDRSAEEDDQAQVYFNKFRDWYIVCERSSISRSEICDLFYDTAFITVDEEEAVDNYNNWSVDIPPIREQISEFKQSLPDVLRDKVWINVKNGLYSYSFQVKYRNLLIVDKLPSLDLEYVLQAIRDFCSFEAQLEEHKISICEIYKKREWNGNQRYFICELYSPRAKGFVYKQHIPSKLQGKCRRVTDLLQLDKILAVEEDVISERGDIVKIEEIIEQPEYDKTITANPFSPEEGKSLLDYLASVLKFSAMESDTCDGSLRLTADFLKKNDFEGERLYQALAFLRQNGGYCDCEVLMNCDKVLIGLEEIK